MEKNKGGDTLNLKVDGNKFPKLAKATELANNYKIRAEKAEAESKKLKAKVEVKPSKKQTDKQEGFDYAKLAYLESKKISEEDYEYLEQEVNKTGKELKEILEFDYVKETLKKNQDFRASEDAVPKGSKRSGKTTKDSVDYWMAKGEMPPADQPMLRREYVNAKVKKETDGSKFTEKPVIG